MTKQEIRKNNLYLNTPELEHLNICQNIEFYPKLGKTNKYDPVIYGENLFPLPKLIMLETTSWCNLSCRFCPSKDLKREKEIMPMELFIKIVDELDRIKWFGELQLFNSNEPLLDPLLIQRIKYIKKLPFLKKSFIGVMTNMKKLTKKILNELYLSGLDQLVCDNYFPDNISCKYIKMFKDFENNFVERKITFIDNYKFYNKLKINRKDFNIMFFQKFGKNTSKVFGKNFTSRLQLITTGKKLENFKKRMCIRPFRHITITYNGKILSCCDEWLYDPRSIMGDLNKNTLIEIWNGKPFFVLRYRLLQYDRSFYPCNKCDNHGEPFWFNCRSVSKEGLF
ncbi:MAG: SPASM domain-containing protein [bacterium]